MFSTLWEFTAGGSRNSIANKCKSEEHLTQLHRQLMEHLNFLCLRGGTERTHMFFLSSVKGVYRPTNVPQREKPVWLTAFAATCTFNCFFVWHLCFPSPQRVFRGCRIRRRLRHTMEGVRSLTGGTVEAMQEVDISELSFLDSFQSDDCSDLFTLSLPMSSFYFLHDVAFPVHPIVSPCSTEHPFPQRISQVSRRKKLPLSREGLPEGCPSVEGKAFSSVPSVPPPSCLSPATEPRLPTPSPSIPPPIKKGLEPNGPASVKAPSSPPEGHAEGEGDRAEEGRRRAETTGEKEERRSRNDVSEKRDSGTTSSLQLLVASPTRKAYSSVGSPGDGAAVTLKKMEIKPHAPSVSSKLQALRGENSLGSSPSRIDARLRFRSEPIVEDQGGSQKVSESNVLDGTSTFTDHRCLSPLTREKRDNFARFGHEHQRDKKPFQAREAGVAGMESLLDRLRTVQEIRPHAAEAAASLAISGEVEIGKVLHRASSAATPVHNESRSQQSKSTTSRSQHTSAHNSYVSREESTDCCSLASSCTKRQHTALIPSERRCEKNHRTANVTASVDMEKLSPPRNQNSVHKRADYWAHFPQPASTTVLSAENADARADLVVPQFEDHVPQTHMASRESQAETSDKHINRNAFWDGENTPATCAVLPIVISRQQLLLRRGTTRAERMEISHQKRKRNSLSTITRPVSESFACFAADGDKRVSFRRSGREGDINALELMSTHKTSSHNIAQSPLNCDRQDDRNIRDIREQLAAVRDQLQRLPKTRKAQNAVARWKLVQELQTLEEQEKLIMERSLSGGVR
uniref:Uncharacterized protein n=1 Tax=Toxoplasma gondii (strain ATCC 50861 / VEG) TaxID=432359 RepID=A0A0F7UUG5_TOXGV|nr:TPA: hypothetical protein BN1205_054380 [Toxoplasma gondii VEG]